MHRSFILKKFWSLALCCASFFGLSAQKKDTLLLLSNKGVEVQATAALDSMYNFNFRASSKRFYWLRQSYSSHPLPYLLFAMSAWWRIMPNTEERIYDNTFLCYIDSTIRTSEKLIKEDFHTEGAFFLSSAYAFLARFYGEREAWLKAAWAGRNALQYLKISQEKKYLSVELLLGDAIFNYYYVWLKENYPHLRPLLSFFKKGNKELGLRQIDYVAKNAFYTRIEAQTLLMHILNEENKNKTEALHIASYLHKKYPNNPYFHRYYARMLYELGKYSTCRLACESILSRLEKNITGYEANSGRYCSFFLGWIHQIIRHEPQAAKKYYLKSLTYAQQAKAAKKGYTLHALLALGDISAQEKRYKKASTYYKKARNLSKRGSKIRKTIHNKQKKLKKTKAKKQTP